MRVDTTEGQRGWREHGPLVKLDGLDEENADNTQGRGKNEVAESLPTWQLSVNYGVAKSESDTGCISLVNDEPARPTRFSRSFHPRE